MIFLGCGAPGQGKTTWIKANMQDTDLYVSRDVIRFHLLNKDDDYFAKEGKVLKYFKNNVKEAVERGFNIWVDATFLSPKSRKWVLELALQHDVKVHAIAFQHPLYQCLEWNDKREGRAHVPPSAIRKMYEQFELPTIEEGFSSITIVA